MIAKNKIKLGLIGVGGHGEKLAKAILNSDNLELVACYHHQKKKAEEYAKEYNCLPSSDLTKMLREGEIKGVVIATPNHLHYEQIKKCIKYKKHIFVEKPITNQLSEAREVIREASNNSLILMVGHNFRRNDAIRKIKKLIDNKKIGEFVSAEINISHAGGMKFTKDKWRYYKNKCLGGPLIMNGTHAAEISNYLFGRAKRVVSRVKKLYAPTEAEDTSVLLIELESGGLVYVCNNYNTPATYFIRVYGTKGILEYNKHQHFLTFQGQDINKEQRFLKRLQYKENDTLLEEMKEFGKCILYNETPETGGPEAFNALAIIEAALDSQKKNKFIKVEHFKKNILKKHYDKK